jgi:hypothetical protein
LWLVVVVVMVAAAAAAAAVVAAVAAVVVVDCVHTLRCVSAKHTDPFMQFMHTHICLDCSGSRHKSIKKTGQVPLMMSVNTAEGTMPQQGPTQGNSWRYCILT